MNHTVFSAEPGNLANLNTYKFSGLANRGNTLDVAAVEDAVVISKSSKKSTAAPLKSSVIKKNARRTNHAAGREAQSVRPDLKVGASGRHVGGWEEGGGWRVAQGVACSMWPAGLWQPGGMQRASASLWMQAAAAVGGHCRPEAALGQLWSGARCWGCEDAPS